MQTNSACALGVCRWNQRNPPTCKRAENRHNGTKLRVVEDLNAQAAELGTLSGCIHLLQQRGYAETTVGVEVAHRLTCIGDDKALLTSSSKVNGLFRVS